MIKPKENRYFSNLSSYEWVMTALEPEEQELYLLFNEYTHDWFRIVNSLSNPKGCYGKFRKSKPIKTIKDLMQADISDIEKIPGIGPKSLEVIKEIKGIEPENVKPKKQQLYVYVISRVLNGDEVPIGVASTKDQATKMANKVIKLSIKDWKYKRFDKYNRIKIEDRNLYVTVDKFYIDKLRWEEPK